MIWNRRCSKRARPRPRPGEGGFGQDAAVGGEGILVLFRGGEDIGPVAQDLVAEVAAVRTRQHGVEFGQPRGIFVGLLEGIKAGEGQLALNGFFQAQAEDLGGERLDDVVVGHEFHRGNDLCINLFGGDHDEDDPIRQRLAAAELFQQILAVAAAAEQIVADDHIGHVGPDPAQRLAVAGGHVHVKAAHRLDAHAQGLARDLLIVDDQKAQGFVGIGAVFRGEGIREAGVCGHGDEQVDPSGTEDDSCRHPGATTARRAGFYPGPLAGFLLHQPP